MSKGRRRKQLFLAYNCGLTQQFWRLRCTFRAYDNYNVSANGRLGLKWVGLGSFRGVLGWFVGSLLG